MVVEPAQQRQIVGQTPERVMAAWVWQLTSPGITSRPLASMTSSGVKAGGQVRHGTDGDNFLAGNNNEPVRDERRGGIGQNSAVPDQSVTPHGRKGEISAGEFYAFGRADGHRLF